MQKSKVSISPAFFHDHLVCSDVVNCCVSTCNYFNSFTLIPSQLCLHFSSEFHFAFPLFYILCISWAGLFIFDSRHTNAMFFFPIFQLFYAKIVSSVQSMKASAS